MDERPISHPPCCSSKDENRGERRGDVAAVQRRSGVSSNSNSGGRWGQSWLCKCVAAFGRGLGTTVVPPRGFGAGQVLCLWSRRGALGIVGAVACLTVFLPEPQLVVFFLSSSPGSKLW